MGWSYTGDTILRVWRLFDPTFANSGPLGLERGGAAFWTLPGSVDKQLGVSLYSRLYPFVQRHHGDGVMRRPVADNESNGDA